MATRPRKRPEPTSAGALDIAMEAASRETTTDSPAQRLLIDQGRLVRWQIANERMRFWLGALAGFAGLAAAAVIGMAVWSASQADGLVVEPFSVPPPLEANGLTGSAVADEVLDQLSRLNRESNRLDNVRLSDTWTSNNRVQIPQTGVSIDELNRMLRQWLGRETHVTGSVVISGAQVTLTARSSGGALVRAQGAVIELPALASNVAEQLLAQAKPVQYARILIQRGQAGNAEAVLQRTLQSARNDKDRSAAHLAMTQAYQVQGRVREARDQAVLALGLGRKGALFSISTMERSLGHAGAASEKCDQALRERTWREGSINPERTRAAFTANCMLLVGDYQSAKAIYADIAPGATVGGRENHLWSLILLHEPNAARLDMPLMMTSSKLRGESFRATLTARILAEEENWQGLLDALVPGSVLLVPGQLEAPTPDAWRALALARLGRIAEAQAMAAALPGDCYRCLRTRAEVAEAAGDKAGADRYFAEAVRQAPKLAFAETDWARVLLARGDAKGALAKARSASRKSPRFADALEVWGEALLAQGKAEAAIAKFEGANALTPRWGRLHLVWGEALAEQRKAQAARERWAIAQRLDLSPSERARLVRNLAGGKA